MCVHSHFNILGICMCDTLRVIAENCQYMRTRLMEKLLWLDEVESERTLAVGVKCCFCKNVSLYSARAVIDQILADLFFNFLPPIVLESALILSFVVD